MTTHTKLAAAVLVLAVLGGSLSVAGCSRPDETGEPATAPAPASPDVHRFKIGSLEAIALRDGGMTVPNDNAILGVGRTPAEVAAVLTASGLPGDTLSLNIQPLLVRDGARLVLLDAGGGVSMGDSAGRLAASLTTAGIEPAQITDVLISHSHGDHVVGLVDRAVALTFPSATIRIAAAEWTWMQANSQLRDLVTAITPRVETFQPGAQLTPGIRAVAIAGHTPGHMGYEIASGDERLLYIGDAMHHSVISVQRPEWQIAFDNDPPVATASRRALAERAAAENLRLYAVHFPFPGVGRIQRKDDGFVWVAEQ